MAGEGTSQEGERPPYFVWHSTDASIHAGTVSICAVIEVILTSTIVLFGFFFAWPYARLYPWISVLVAPLLLLRSPQSVMLGIKWFEHFVNDGWGQDPRRALSSALLWLGWTVAVVAMTVAVGWLSATIGSFHPIWFKAVLYGATGYISIQVGIAVVVAVCAHEFAALIVWKSPPIVTALSIIFAAVGGLVVSGTEWPYALITMATIFVALVAVLLEAPGAISVMKQMPRSVDKALVAPVIEGIATQTPISLTLITFGVFIGGCLRTFFIRFFATVSHFRAGLIALHDNWYRTLFVTDFWHPPEVIPGYTKSDLIQVSLLFAAIRKSKKISELILYSIIFLTVFGPALFYRLTIKSTFWFYIPLAYVMKPSRYTDDAALFIDLVWNRWAERCRFILAVSVLTASFAHQSTNAYLGLRLPPNAISMLEYVFVFDFTGVKPWQWFNLASCLLTVLIYVIGDAASARLRNVDRRPALHVEVNRFAYILDRAKRARNLTSYGFLLFAFLHVLLWTAPERLPPYAVDALRRLFSYAASIDLHYA